MPGIAVEDVVEQLEKLGYACDFSPESDISAAWNCLGGNQAAGDWTQISLIAQEAGPIEGASAFRSIQVGPDSGPDSSVLDREGAATFRLLIDVVVPAEHRPSDAELLDGVRRNYPMEFGGGWFIGFDRSSILRTMSIVFAGDG